MNYIELVNMFSKLACVLSVDINEDGTYGEMYVEAANTMYLESVNVKPEDFVPGQLYETYVPKEREFESMVQRCIGENKHVHSYIDAPYFKVWLDVFLLPLVSNDKKKGFCLFSYNMSQRVESERMADIPPTVAWQVIKTSFRLREKDDFEQAVQYVVDDIREYCKADRACLLLTDLDKRKCSVLADSLDEKDDTPKMSNYVDDKFFRIVEGWQAMLGESNCFIVYDEEDMERLTPTNPEWFGAMKMAGARNLVMYALRSNDKTIGYIWVTNFEVENIPNIKATLETTRFILATEISNHFMFEEMKRLSITDLLTGLNNRNAISRRIENIISGEEELKMPYGIVFMDLNGLKKVNDTKGHVAGDHFLINAAEILKEIYDQYEIYRIGGDEFVVLAMKITTQDFDNKVRILREQSNEYEQETFSIGTWYTEDDKDLAKAMRIADERMYKDKEAYYAKHPEKKQ